MSLKKLLCFCVLLCAMFAYGTPVEPSVAKQVACNFWSGNAGKTTSVDLVNVTDQFGFQELYTARELWRRLRHCPSPFPSPFSYSTW